jgi:hypothetical protein
MQWKIVENGIQIIKLHMLLKNEHIFPEIYKALDFLKV